MHIVTKFLVVVAAVLAVLLSGLTIAYTGNAARLRDAVQIERDAKAVAETLAQQANAAAQAERLSLEQQVDAIRTELEQARQELRQRQGENAVLLAENKRLELSTATYEARIDQFLARIEQFAKQGEMRDQELGLLRDKELKRALQEIELLDRINDLTGQLDVSQENVRRLQEETVAVREELDRVRSGGGSAAGAAATLRAPENFRARVKDVSEDPATGATMVAIDAGSSDRLKTNMELNIIREGYLAKVVLTRVDLNESVGVVNFLGGKPVEIRPGDLVMPSAL